MRPAISVVPLTAALVLLSFVLASSTDARKAGGAKKHDVDLLWKPDEQDLYTGKTVVDSFDSSGPPFGEEGVETLTPRSQINQDVRSGKWRVFVNPGAQGPNSGQCFGTFKVDRNVIETTQQQQTVEHGGRLRLDGCKNTKRFSNAEPGPFGTLRGETICSPSRCRGGLEIKGSMRY